MARGNYVFGSKTKAMLKRAQQESKYFNTVYAEYNNIINRVTNGKVVPVSDLTRDQRDAAINYFMSRFGAKKKSAEQALDMINAYQRDFLQGNRIYTVNTPRTDNTIVFAPSDTPTLIQ